VFYDLNGKIIYSYFNNKTENTINLSGIRKGVYIIVIKENKGAVLLNRKTLIE
jgi:hypothetical protein